MSAAAKVPEVYGYTELVGIQVEMEPIGIGVAFLAAKGAPPAFSRPNYRRLDFDDFRPEIGKQFPRHRGGKKGHRVEAGQLHDLDTVKCKRVQHHLSC